MTLDTSLVPSAIEPGNAAVRAWSQLRAGGPEPTRVEILKHRHGSHVYRLAGAGPDGSNVVAKRCLKARALAERAIYEQVLRHLPGRSLMYRGLVAERGTPFCWLFVEDAAGVPYSPTTAEHGRLAADWLAGLHTGARTLGCGLDLPVRGPTWYLGCVRSGRDRIRRSLGNPALSDDDRAALEAIVEQCDSAESRWRQVEECCGAASPTLVHADLHAKNIHVSPDGSALLPFDWESASWGPPAIDLGLRGLDLPAYRLRVRSTWPELESGRLEKLVVVGRLFQLVAHVEWEARGLSSPWLHRPMKHMRYYLAEMTEALRAAQAL
jgi:hypothetical protein